MTPTIRSLEAVTRVTTLGLAFVDVATGQRIADGLDVRARGISARCSRAGVWYFSQLPGMSAAERGAGDAQWWAGIATTGFRVSVTDSLGRYRPVEFDAHVPARGVFVPDCVAAENSPFEFTAIPMYPDVAYGPPAGVAAIRAELYRALDDRPAARAFLEVFCEGERVGRGLAGDDGRVLATMPWPKPRGFNTGFMLTGGSGRALAAQTWKVRIAVRYAADPHPTPLPDLCSVLAQPEVPVWARNDWSSTLPEQDLVFGRELTVQSVDAARQVPSQRLWVGAHP